MLVRRLILGFLVVFWVGFVPYLVAGYAKKIDVLIEFNKRNAVEEYKPCG